MKAKPEENTIAKFSFGENARARGFLSFGGFFVAYSRARNCALNHYSNLTVQLKCTHGEMASTDASAFVGNLS